ncbi:MAG: hypothetical protein AB1817_10200 [Chloroflexota bacterium]
MRKFIAFLLVLFFVVTLPIALLMFNVGRVIFDKALVKQVVAREVTESNLIPVTLRWFAQRRAQERVMTGEAKTAISEPDTLKALQFPTVEHWRQIRAEAMPNQFLTIWVSVTLDSVYAWLDTKDPLPNVILDLKPWKDYNRSAHGHQAIQIVYSTLPPCQQADIDDFLKRLNAAPPGQEILYNLYTPCMFPDPWRPDQNQDYLNERDKIIDTAPNFFALTQELARVEKESGVGAANIKQQILLFRTLAQWSILGPILILLLLVLLAWRSRFDFARWLGAPILVGGVLSLLPTLIYQPIVNAVLTAGPMSEVPREVQTEFTRAFGVLLAEIFNPMLLQSAVILLIGLAIAAIGLFGKPRISQSVNQ